MDLRHKLSDLEIPIERPCGNKFLRTLCEQDAKFQGIEIEEPLPIAGLLFAQYQYAVKELDKMYDEEIQPQMGIAIRRLLEAANKRLMELKEDLVEIDVSEYHYIDGNVVQLKLVPKDFEIIHLEGLPKKRDPQLQDNIDKLLLKGMQKIVYNIQAGPVGTQRPCLCINLFR